MQLLSSRSSSSSCNFSASSEASCCSKRARQALSNIIITDIGNVINRIQNSHFIFGSTSRTEAAIQARKEDDCGMNLTCVGRSPRGSSSCRWWNWHFKTPQDKKDTTTDSIDLPGDTFSRNDYALWMPSWHVKEYDWLAEVSERPSGLTVFVPCMFFDHSAEDLFFSVRSCLLCKNTVPTHGLEAWVRILSRLVGSKQIMLRPPIAFLVCQGWVRPHAHASCLPCILRD